MLRKCPSCPLALEPFTMSGLKFYACREHGVLTGAATLRPLFKDRALADFCLSRIAAPLDQFRESARLCPQCRSAFLIFSTPTFVDEKIDICQRCQLFWFDTGEWEAAKAARFVTVETAAIRAPVPRKIAWPSNNPANVVVGDELLSYFMPVEISPRAKSTPPVATYAFIVAAIAMTARASKHYALFEQWTFFPEQPWRFGTFAAIFLHAGWYHLLGNAVVLVVAGDDVEDELGHAEFIALFLLAGLGGHLIYLLAGGKAPSVGMSGAISGVMAYYGLRFPKQLLEFRIFNSFNSAPLIISAGTALLLWAFTQFASAYLQTVGLLPSRTNFLAHAGGLLVGGAFALFHSRDDQTQ